ncbi:GntR family transcriptional regulator [Clostridium malenominatum]|uniref:GntR family transcriptional regulator n=1 Tax=Clostridium malenominatum TaxID=1539 RepID=A0ABN1IZN9_9CLOT
MIKKNNKNEKKNLAQEAYNAIRLKIFNNGIKPGQLISESLIAEELGISRTPVREAIRMLAIEGVVESRDGIGTIVKMFSFKEIKDIFEVRKALEIIAVKTSINNVSELEVSELLNKYSDISVRFEAGIAEEREFTEIDMKVHNLIITRCDNDYVKGLYNSIGLKIKLYQYVSYLNFRSSAESISQHMEILRLIKNKELEKLIIALNEHIDWSLKWYLEALM